MDNMRYRLVVMEDNTVIAYFMYRVDGAFLRDNYWPSAKIQVKRFDSEEWVFES